MSRLVFRCTSAPMILGVALLAVGIAGCGGSSNSSSAGSTSSSAAESSTAPSAASTSTSSTSAGSSTAAAPTPAGAPQILHLSADPSGALSYNTTTLTAKPGKATIVFTNMAPLPHNVTVQSSTGSTLGATPTFSGGAKSIVVNLTAGTYTFFCSVPGHRQAGMQGTLTVG